MDSIGVIGLGNMGRGMALTLRRAGLGVSGFDQAEQARATLAGEGITIAADVATLATSVDLLVLSLPNAGAVRAVIEGAGGVLAHGRKGLIVVDTTTSEPETTRDLAAKLDAAGMALLDAPVSGGPKGAASGTMTMVIGGDAAVLARAEPVLATMTGKRVHVGPSGAGHATKLINNLLCAAHLVTLREAVALAKGAGLDPVQVFSGINAGSGRSGVSEVNWPLWIANGAFDSGFTMGLMRKDVRLGAGLAASLGLALPLLDETARLWGESAGALADGEDFNRIASLPASGARA